MLKPGDAAPPFDLPAAIDDRIDRVNSAKVNSELILLFFYPRDFSFICPTEVSGFNKALEKFAAESTTIMGASVDSTESHRKWSRELGGVGYPLLADEKRTLAQAYGVLDVEEQVAIRATFIIDRLRRVVYSCACPLNIGRSIDETLRIVQAIRTGRLCPADWTPGVEFGPASGKF